MTVLHVLTLFGAGVAGVVIGTAVACALIKFVLLPMLDWVLG